jgi:hypothetical protein
MNHIPNFEEFINESFHMPDGTPIGVDKNHQPIKRATGLVLDDLTENINDPVLMAIRASKDDRKKAVAAQKERMKKRVYGKKREDLENKLWAINQDLKDAYIERRNIYDDMEDEAGQKGNDWSDDDANRYGSRLNLVDDEIESLLKRRQEIELKLSY